MTALDLLLFSHDTIHYNARALTDTARVYHRHSCFFIRFFFIILPVLMARCCWFSGFVEKVLIAPG